MPASAFSGFKALRRLRAFVAELPRSRVTSRQLLLQLAGWRLRMDADALTLGLTAALLEARIANRHGAGRVTHVIAASHAAIGGGEYIAASTCAALLALRPEAVILLITNGSDETPVWPELPACVHHIGMSAFVPSWADGAFHVRALGMLVQMLRPESLHVINHTYAWQLICDPEQRLRLQTRFYATVFAREYWGGIFYAGFTRQAQEALPWLDGLLSDNQCVLDEINAGHAGRYGERLYCLPSPCRLSLAQLQPATDNLLLPHPARPHFIWAGRLSPEKRPELFFALAGCLPGSDFIVHGGQTDAVMDAIPALDNLVCAGKFSSPVEWLARGHVTALVFTSHWEGLPNVLLEAGLLGIPVIAPKVGGVGELITDETGYLLPPTPSAADFKAVMERIIGCPAEALAKAARLRERVSSHYTAASFQKSLADIPGYVRCMAGDVGTDMT